jgi:hypothetical protein
VSRARIFTLCALLLPLSGCAVLHRVEPDSASVVIEHVSHITQHPPIAQLLGQKPTNFGFDTAGLQARWAGRRWWLTIADGARVFSGYLPGPREVFQAQLGYTFWRAR